MTTWWLRVLLVWTLTVTGVSLDLAGEQVIVIFDVANDAGQRVLVDQTMNFRITEPVAKVMDSLQAHIDRLKSTGTTMVPIPVGIRIRSSF